MEKTSVPKIIIVAAFCFALYILSVYFTSSAAGLNQPAYTVFSARDNGVSLLYDTLKFMEYPVDISFEKITARTVKQDVQIITYPDPYYSTDADKKEFLEWVESGGRLIYFVDSNGSSPIRNGTPLGREIESFGPFTLYDYGYGQIIVCSGELMTNHNLKNNADYGDVVCNILAKWDYGKIYFNEYYHGFQQNPTIWKNIPLNFKLLIYQLAITVLLILWFFGKRFGRPVPYYEEIEREENEYLKALSTLYEKADMGEIAVNSYYNNFLRQCCKFFSVNISELRENIPFYWERANLKYLDLLRETLKEINSEINSEANSEIKSIKKYSLKRKKDRRSFFKILKNIKKLSGELR